jgi:3'(2'),5'-bisphosphate nucleotidase
MQQGELRGAVSAAQLQRLVDIAQDAGRAVMAVYEASAATGGAVRAKADATPLTEADLQADALILAALARDFPGIGVVSEESGPARTSGAPGEACFLVDPLDGTREFLARNGEFTVNIALVAGGTALAGVVLAPALGSCYFAARGLGAWKTQSLAGGGTGAPVALHVRPRAPGAPLRIVASRSHGGERLDAHIGKLRLPHALVPVGSSLKFCVVAEGQADVYPRFGPTSQWDTAAAQCVLEAAGGQVLDRGGQPLRYGADRPLLNPEFVALGDATLLALFA